MKSIEISAKTVEEAIDLALNELNLTKDEVNIEVLEQPSKGFFGIIGTKKAVVKVDEIYNPTKKAKDFLMQIFAPMNLNPKIEIVEDKSSVTFNITGDDLGILIGRRGDTLDSLQFLLNLVMNKDNESRTKYIIDIEGYRKKREETLLNLALRLGDKAKRTGRKVILEPMNPQERRIIHMTLQNDTEIGTYSEGEEPYRKVVIIPKIKRN
ncbi:spoIIIJ-associated protein [Desulfonispora thiosulfatigenes DSM 11270]|uniref:RNA-binding protein KhpB n=1 Tax=Desulfonispora thiosulfatigenes DSM 11270 TaxID=656914 RepID=A0A1W1V2I3_DESTI|nr:RNA-binding cell elongation regulator Jag/EloR [Desulfonispora thiosulfatigenes]SMB87533.1 spoIIIJ-associated protein [Desulfonispora thiosulfatigenes DSM 11270]